MNKHLFILGAALLLPFAPLSATVAAPKSAGDVVIISTGDRQTPGYRVRVTPDGTLSSALVPRGHHTPIRHSDMLIALTRQRFFADLAKAEPVSKLPTGTITAPFGRQGGRRGRGGRGRSGQRAAAVTPGRINPYPEVFVRHHGQQSPNLRQASSEQGRALYQDVKQILSVLRLPIPNVP